MMIHHLFLRREFQIKCLTLKWRKKCLCLTDKSESNDNSECDKSALVGRCLPATKRTPNGLQKWSASKYDKRWTRLSAQYRVTSFSSWYYEKLNKNNYFPTLESFASLKMSQFPWKMPCSTRTRQNSTKTWHLPYNWYRQLFRMDHATATRLWTLHWECHRICLVQPILCAIHKIAVSTDIHRFYDHYHRQTG